MTKAWRQEEENPYHNYSYLTNDCAICSGTKFSKDNSTSIEHCTCHEEAYSVDNQNGFSVELFYSYEYIVCMVVDALTFIKGACVQLGGN